MTSDIWNLLHDGWIAQIQGRVPGTITLRIECDYLRKYFPEPGTAFVISLANCTAFDFTEYGASQTISDLGQIEKLSLEILSSGESNSIHVACHGTGGTIRIQADHSHIALDSAESINIEDLRKAADDYWEKFKLRRIRDSH
jgi:hypothetical protein